MARGYVIGYTSHDFGEGKIMAAACHQTQRFDLYDHFSVRNYIFCR